MDFVGMPLATMRQQIASAAAEAIYNVATDKIYARQLIEAGKKQLETYDNYKQRADKLIGILEDLTLAPRR